MDPALDFWNRILITDYGPIIGVCLGILLCLLLALVRTALRRFSWFRGDGARRAAERALDAFRAEAAETRGWLGFALEIEPRTLVVVRVPGDVPAGAPFAVPPIRFRTPDQLFRFLRRREEIRTIRTIFSDASVQTASTRVGRGVQDRKWLRSYCRSMFSDERRKAARGEEEDAQARIRPDD